MSRIFSFAVLCYRIKRVDDLDQTYPPEFVAYLSARVTFQKDLNQ